MTNRGTRLDLTELPEDWIAYCTERRPDLKPFDVWQDFEDYWKGRGETMVDWKRTWQTWVRNTRKKPVFAQEAPKRSYPQSKPLPERRPDSAAYREFRERMAKLKDGSASPAAGSSCLLGASPRSIPPFLSLGSLVDEEWQEERLAMQQQDQNANQT